MQASYQIQLLRYLGILRFIRVIKQLNKYDDIKRTYFMVQRIGGIYTHQRMWETIPI